MKFIIANWYWLLVFVSVIGICIMQLIKEENPNSRWKNWWNIGLMLLGVTGGIGGMVSTYQNQIDQMKMQNTIDATKNVSISTKAKVDTNLELSNQIQKLSTLNNEIANNIVTLTTLNNKIASSTQTLAKDGKTLIKQNLVSTSNLNNLTENAKFLLDKIYDEQIGGNSIPLVYVTTFKDEIRQWEDGGYVIQPYKNSDMYLKFIDLVNTGEYKLTDIVVIASRSVYRQALPDQELLYDKSLLPKQAVRLLELPMEKLHHPSDGDTTEEGKPIRYSYFEEDFWGNGRKTLSVSWRNLRYEYIYEIVTDTEITVSDYYVYKNKTYPKKEDLYNAIMEERRQEKLKRMKLPN